jgi:hypothetical protein
MAESKQSYPLHWPAGWKRTANRKRGVFRIGFDTARRHLQAEVARMGGSDLIISTDLPLRRDGLPYASGVAKSGDPGVAVYFRRKGHEVAFACDQYMHIQDNLNAIAKSIEAMRGIERWGASDMMERAFRGFTALPAGGASSASWRATLGIAEDAKVTEQSLTKAFRAAVIKTHPDHGGTTDAFQAVNEAMQTARRELRL